MTDKTGGPAFPAPAGVSHITTQGMTLRDWFAGLAMHGFLSNKHDALTYSDDDAMWAYRIADEMLKAREAK